MENDRMRSEVQTPSSPLIDLEHEILEFQEGEAVALPCWLGIDRPLYLRHAVLIKHYSREGSSDNLYQENPIYLHNVFKHYLSRNAQNRRARTSFLAQFYPKTLTTTLHPTDDLPTYVVSYDMNLEPGDFEATIQISYRRITRDSFLLMHFDAHARPPPSEKHRLCLILRRLDETFVLEPKVMTLQGPVDYRAMLVAKHGWLAVFLAKSPQVFLLLEDQCLLVEGTMRQVPITYKRLLHATSSPTSEPDIYLRRNEMEHAEGFCQGAIVSHGVLHNESLSSEFTLIGSSNALVNLKYLQQLLSCQN